MFDDLIQKTGLTAEELQQARDNPPQTRENLRDWVKVFLDVWLIDVAVEPGFSTPLDFVWDGYSKTVLGHAEDGKCRVLGMAARGSQKTLCCAVLEFLCLLFDPNRNQVHLASTEPQSQVCYGYVQRYSENPMYKDLISSSIMSETKAVSGRTLSITHGTMNAVNAYHGGLLCFDEVDLMPKKIFDEAHGMTTDTLKHPGINIYISSRKVAFGNIEDLLQLAAEPNSGIAVHKWGILEQCQPCPDSRSGTKKADYYVDEDRLICLTEKEYNFEFSKTGYSKCSGYEGCGRCGIFSFCKGNLKKAKSFNPYHVTINSVLAKFKSEDGDFFKAQRLNRKPSKVGLIYTDWDEMKNLKTYGQMWEIFHGEPHPEIAKGNTNDISREELVGTFLKAGCRLCLGVDWGFTNPFAALLFAFDGSDRAYIIDYIETIGHSEGECALMCAKRWGHLPVGIFPDPESPGGAKEFRKLIDSMELNWFVSGSVINDIDIGIGIVRNFIRTPGTTKTRLYVHHSINIVKSEMRVYHYKIRKADGVVLDVPEDVDNHAMGACRYVLATLSTAQECL